MIKMILSPDEITKKLISLIEENEEYKALHFAFQSAGQNMEPFLLKKLVCAFENRLHTTLLFCANLGFQENLALFRDPMRRCFLEVDPIDYLKENQLYSLPHYRKASQEIQTLRCSLPHEPFLRLLEYYSFLEMYGEKIAHYYGYLAANILLPHHEPAYSPNTVVSTAYREQLQKDLGLSLPKFF